jgi:quercetin dioxygenase-like cupin family protein
VIAGEMTFRFEDHEETYKAGDAYYVPAGHIPVHHAGAEIVEFSPTEELARTVEVVMENLRTAGVAGGA